MDVTWEKIIASFLHKSFGNITGIIGFVELMKTADAEKREKFAGKVIASVESLESNMRELDLLARDIDAEMERFSLYMMVEQVFCNRESFTFDNENKLIIDKNWFSYHGDSNLAKLAFDLIARILKANLIPHSSIDVNINGLELVFSRMPFQNKFLNSINGSWGYEKQLLFHVLEALDWKMTHGLSNNKEFIHINPFRRYDAELQNIDS